MFKKSNTSLLLTDTNYDDFAAGTDLRVTNCLFMSRKAFKSKNNIANRGHKDVHSDMMKWKGKICIIYIKI